VSLKQLIFILTIISKFRVAQFKGSGYATFDAKGQIEGGQLKY
jgi:hypothetical protein